MEQANTKSVVQRPEQPTKISSSKAKEQNPAGAEITVKQFLDFLKTAYQVNDSVEGVVLADGMSDAVDWIKLKETELVKPREIACQTSEHKIKVMEEKKDVSATKKKSDTSVASSDPADNVKRKLSEVLSEGLLDSVLTYLVPSNPPSVQPSRRPSQQKVSDKIGSNSGSSITSEKVMCRRKSTDSSATGKSLASRSDSEVIIHVCDEVKSQKRDFVCNQKLLIDKMGYFAEVTSGQRLEDMDISVHCDIGIFEWLMRWVKKDQQPEDGVPDLDSQCVIPVLVSAAFLQMEPLLHDCLLYCHQYMNDILRTSTNLSCLNDAVMTRLAAMYTNTEVEAIKDRKDKIQSRLYCKLIQSLCEPEAESMRGHWNSLARVFRCGRCQQLVSPSVGPEIPCISSCMRLLCDGSVIYMHVRDATWNINEYVERLHKSLRTWRKVYWRLWGDAHFLYCTVCKRFFPAHQISWCRFHPDPPQFFTVDAQRAPLPVGRFPCCGERAYRFQLLEGETGCQFREHTPCTETVRDAAVQSMLDSYRSLIEEEAPKLMFPERLTRLVAKAPASGDADGCEGKLEGGHHFWWEGLELIPPRPKLGLLGVFGNTNVVQNNEELPTPPDLPTNDDEYTDCSDSSSSADSSSSSQKSEESYHSPEQKRKGSPRTRAARKREGRLWQHNLSARSNQDLQRSYEESALKQITSILGRRSLLANEPSRITSKAWPRHLTPSGGVWIRVESEWRDRNSLPQQPRMRSLYSTKARLRTARFN